MSLQAELALRIQQTLRTDFDITCQSISFNRALVNRLVPAN